MLSQTHRYSLLQFTNIGEAPVPVSLSPAQFQAKVGRSAYDGRHEYHTPIFFGERGNGRLRIESHGRQ
jgi:hypothetical protein